MRAVLPDGLSLQRIARGRHRRMHDVLGAHPCLTDGLPGYRFAVWAPRAQGVSVVGDFNGWDPAANPLCSEAGIWYGFVPGVPDGACYKFAIRTADRRLLFKADPCARRAQHPPETASITCARSTYCWQDTQWIAARGARSWERSAVALYEVHLGSWWRHLDGSPRTYREAAASLVWYVRQMGFTHIEFLPLAAHPYDPSWGYQITGYFSPTSRFGDPDDLRYLIDQCHQHGIGVILDWVPGHFPADAHALARYDGACLYEHEDPRRGVHPDWDTLIFDYDNPCVRNFLIANALYWIEAFHIDGLRVDAVASMLYLDYSRAAGEWLPNRRGGKENLSAITLLRTLNDQIGRHHPGVMVIAEESTAWPGVTAPTAAGGLGFGLKWCMGWMHDLLAYMRLDPLHRKYHHGLLVDALGYAFSERFVLPFSHDEVVHGKGSLLAKMPGDRRQQFAHLRLLFGYQYACPGKKHLFMGAEIAQPGEWNHDASIGWELLQEPDHRGVQQLVADLNRLYRAESALHADESAASGFRWVEADDVDHSVLAFLRCGGQPQEAVLVVCNFTPVPRHGYRVGVPQAGWYRELVNTDAACYGGANIGNLGGLYAERVPWHGFDWSLPLTVPPLAVLFFRCPDAGAAAG